MKNQNKRALVAATVAPFIEHFESNDIHILQSYGYEVFVATNFTGYEDRHQLLEENAGVALDHQFQVDFSRSPFTFDIPNAYKQLKEILFKYKFTLLHCHTPVGGVLARLAAKSYNDAIDRRIKEHKSALEKLKVIYTAHGFHFYKGAPLKYWMVFYPVEKYLSRYTDVLITINKEDYNRAFEEFYAKKIAYVPGVGVDVKKFESVSASIDREKKREELGVKEHDIILLSVGELNENKNHSVVIKALGQLQRDGKIRAGHIIYMIAGSGDKKKEFEIISREEGVAVRLLGYREDVDELLTAADLYILPSIREGLNVSLMEAMASGTPCLASKIRGNVDLVDTAKGGELFDPQNIYSVADAIITEVKHKDEWQRQGEYNQVKMKMFDSEIVKNKMSKIYRSI